LRCSLAIPASRRKHRSSCTPCQGTGVQRLREPIARYTEVPSQHVSGAEVDDVTDFDEFVNTRGDLPTRSRLPIERRL